VNLAHLHLILNHFPVVGSVIVALLLAFALQRRSDDVGRAALLLAALIGVMAIITYFTGERVEELVERLPDVSKAAIEEHEDAALVATIVVGALGAFSIVGLYFHRGARALSRRMTGSALVLSLVACAAMGYTALLGGQVRHSEIRGPTAVTVAPKDEHDR
jgi:uncharacterized membrane protein